MASAARNVCDTCLLPSSMSTGSFGSVLMVLSVNGFLRAAVLAASRSLIRRAAGRVERRIHVSACMRSKLVTSNSALNSCVAKISINDNINILFISLYIGGIAGSVLLEPALSLLLLPSSLVCFVVAVVVLVCFVPSLLVCLVVGVVVLDCLVDFLLVDLALLVVLFFFGAIMLNIRECTGKRRGRLHRCLRRESGGLNHKKV